MSNFVLTEEDIKQRPNGMDEKRSLLLQQYCDYHSSNGTEISEESLVKQSREFLTLAEPEERFINLNLDVYENLLGRIAKNQKSDQESILRIGSGFKSLEQYGVNLWRFPWRKEYHTIKVCS